MYLRKAIAIMEKVKKMSKISDWYENRKKELGLSKDGSTANS